jgi:hypothetical protein
MIFFFVIYFFIIFNEEEFEDTKEVIRIRISKKNKQHNDQNKKYKQRSTKHAHKTTGHQHQNIDSFKQNLPSKITPTKPHSFFTWKFYSSVIDSYKTMYCYGDLNLFVALMFIYIFLYSFIMLMVYYISLMCINKSMRICLCKILILHICNSGPGGSMS